MTESEMKLRTKVFALRVLKLIDSLPNTRSGRVLAAQLGRSGTSVGANYRAACRSRSVAEMISKFAVVEEEADESAFWIELIGDHGVVPAVKLASLLREAGELTAMMVASRKTLSAKERKSKIENRKSKVR
ncbi:MAG TPA: four helix bundle protein [Opitutaceae bacterium]|nr:four helix bundle protein [Opitutaceae bacterium]